MKEFYKKNKGDSIYWVKGDGKIGMHLFSFDKEVVFNLFADYPWKLTKDQKEIFDKENPFWANFFKGRM